MSEPTVLWAKQNLSFNTDVADYRPSCVVDTAGNTYICYYTGGTVSGGTNIGEYDIVVFKLDTSGNTVWTKQIEIFDTTLDDTVPDIGVDSNGNSYIAYQSIGIVSGGSKTGDPDIVVFKLDTLGNVVWTKQNETFNAPAAGYSMDNLDPRIAVDPSGNSYICYLTDSVISGGTATTDIEIAVFKLDTLGNTVWTAQNDTFNALNYGGDRPDIAVDTNGNCYICFITSGTVSGGTNMGDYDIVVFKLNPSGQTVWTKQKTAFNTPLYDDRPSIAVDTNGNSYICFTTAGTSSGGTNMGSLDIVVFKLDTSGNVMWTKQETTFNTVEGDSSPRIVADSSGNSYICYNTMNGLVSGGTQTVTGTQIVIFKLNTSGTTVWAKQDPSFNAEVPDPDPVWAYSSNEFASFGVDSTGNLYLTYQAQGTISGGTNPDMYANDIVVIKFGFNDPPCFSHGTQILCWKPEGDFYIPVQDITPGICVKTYRHRCRKVMLIGHGSMVNTPANYKQCMYRYPKEKDMLDDLVVTGDHSILEWAPPTDPEEIRKQAMYWGNKKFTIDGYYMRLAAVSNKFRPIMDSKKYDYYHLVLDDAGDHSRHYGIWANGVLVESQSYGCFMRSHYDVTQS